MSGAPSRFGLFYYRNIGYNRNRKNTKETIMSDDNLDQFYADRDDLIAQKEAAEKSAEEDNAKLAELKLNTEFETAYRDAGGSAETIELMKSFLGDKMQIQNAQSVILDKYGMVEKNKDGQPKSFAEKFTELSKTSAFKNCFATADTGSQINDQAGPKTYKREDAQAGKVSIEDIAFGRIQLEGVDSTRKPDTKRVSPEQIADIKKRTWK